MKATDVSPPELDTLLKPKADRRRNSRDGLGTSTDECHRSAAPPAGQTAPASESAHRD
jgi:hypothetical protein